MFLLSLLLLSGVGACVRVWKGVDDVLCGVQAHKCPKGGLEPLSVESPIIGMRPGNHYTMPVFKNFTLLKKIGKAKIDCYCSIDLIIESLEFYKNFVPQKS